MGQALYRKHRPRNFSETVGQEAITKTLAEAVASGRISHAYLFSGPRGIGKTSVARILAHEINGLPYHAASTNLDIIEIDAASNRRIDEIRDLREKVHIAPVASKYKVYIIDEVHMLTKEAFNALLKTLEEPPKHCVFILATTEAHKLPETIVSRTQKYTFRPIASVATVNYLERIAKAEKINISNEALAMLSESAEGSLRDAVSLLDQLSASGRQITEEDVRALIGLPPPSLITDLFESIVGGDPSKSLESLESLRNQAADPTKIAQELGRRLRQLLIEKKGTERLTHLLKELLAVSGSANPTEMLEIAVLSAASQQVVSENPEPIAKTTSGKAKKSTVPLSIKTRQKDNPEVVAPAVKFSLEQWRNLLALVKEQAPSLYTALRLAEPSLNNGRLDLAFRFALHQKKVKESKHIRIIASLIEKMSGDKLVISCRVQKDLAPGPYLNQAASNDPQGLQTISNIFGSAEVLES